MKMRLGVATIQNQFQEIETWDPSHLSTLYLCPNSHPTMCPLMSYDVGENTALIASHFPLSAMPLKSDGSLGIMEALGRSRCRKAEDGLYYSQTQTNATTNVNILQSHQQPLLQSEKRPSAPKLPYNLPLPAKSNHRSSQYRGVTRHRWTGRYEAHLWDNTCKKQGQTKKGRQVYLGGYDKEEKAARAYDLAALKYWGPSTHTNFALENYQAEMEEMKNMNRQEYVAHLRRKSSGFSRGASMYRGVTRHHQEGRWQARIGRVAGNKDLYLGTFSSEELAAEAYDIAAIRFRGVNAVTNFDVCRYDVERIMGSKSKSNSLLSVEHAPNKHIHGEARKEMGESTTGIINNNYTNSIHHSSLHHTLVFPTPPHLHTPIINNIALLPSHLPVFAAWTDSSFI